MSIVDIKRGDLLDYPARELHSGEVTRVGHATVWLVFTLPNGAKLPITAEPSALKPHVNHNRVQIGEYTIRDAEAGLIWIQSAKTGEAMQTDTAKLETHIAKFWDKEF